jgi:hypothetical protein
MQKDSQEITKHAPAVQFMNLKRHERGNQLQNDEKPSNTRSDELKAIDLNLARAVKQASFAGGLNGNEETAVIYGFIFQAQTKNVYKELVKFHKRTNFLELCILFLQKALTENLTYEVSDCCADTHEWLNKRNTTILGNKSLVTKKIGMVAVSDNRQSMQPNNPEFPDDPENKKERNNAESIKSQVTNMAQQLKRRRIKKYKLLIPLNLDENRRLELEEKQKEAIDKIYDLFPEMHGKWIRKRRLRRLLNDECSFRSQLAAIWALSQFGIFMHHIEQFQSEYNLSLMLHESNYLDPQQFLFDFNSCLIVSDAVNNTNPVLKFDKKSSDDQNSRFSEYQEFISTQTSRTLETNRKTTKPSLKQNSKTSAKNTDYKDTSDLLSKVLSGFDKQTEDDPRDHANQDKNNLKSSNHLVSANTSDATLKTIAESLKGIFGKFEKSIVSVRTDPESSFFLSSLF